ncbi:MAG TPA: hypothetical protein VFX70_07775 [Mycobacteriales bacterium]|nr:hypothetical protein [Mycobacteriales bacterium]
MGAPIPSATGTPAPTVQATNIAPSAATSPTSAERAAFVKRLRAISPALATGDVNTRIDEGVSLCAGITGNDPAQEVIVNTAIAFNVSLGDAAKIATAVRDTLCR